MKEANSIIKLGLASEVLILSSGERGQLRNEAVTDQIHVHRVKSFLWWLPDSRFSKALFYLEFYIRAILFGLSIRIDVINCHSLMVLPMSVILKSFKSAKLIYDPHELETERVGLKGYAQRLSKWVEKIFISSADSIIVVGDSIREWYSDAYGVENIHVMRNIPYNVGVERTDLLRTRFNLSDSDQIFLYQGLVSEGRGIELYLKSFSKARPDQHLVIMGYGDLEYLVKEYAGKFSNIHFHEAVRPERLLEYTCSADVGLSLIENVCLSYYYCLPNKFFEYIIAEIPMIVSDFPEMSRLVRQYDLGWAIAVREESLVSALETLSAGVLSEKKKNVRRAKPFFSWETEELVLSEVFGKVLKEREFSERRFFL